MKEERFSIGAVPAVLLGEPSDSLFLFVHGQGGSKEEAAAFAELACPQGWQVLGLDLPEHGGRSDSAIFDPWHAVPELRQVMSYAKARWQRLGLRANSIGCYFSLLALSGEELSKCLLVSPLVDMESMIAGLMHLAGVTEQQLMEEKLIKTGFGPTLSWEYLCYAREHRIQSCTAGARILHADNDEQVDARTMDDFAARFHCDVTVMEGGEHWFHTPEELDVLRRWEQASLAL